MATTCVHLNISVNKTEECHIRKKKERKTERLPYFKYIYMLKYFFTQIFELSGEPSSSLVLELLSFEAQVYSVPTKDCNICQEKQHSSCIFARVVQALKYPTVTTYEKI